MQAHIITNIIHRLRLLLPEDAIYERSLVVKLAPYFDAFVQSLPFPPFEVEIQTSSECNLHCAWCIGDEVQQRKQVLHLPNNIKKHNIDTIVDGILNCHIGDLRIERIKFSGFIGEPLLSPATLVAAASLTGAGRRVGLFTNGILMHNRTWEILSRIDYVHVSLDAGSTSFYWLKEPKTYPYTMETFQKVMHNIASLNQRRKQDQTSLRINVGYVIVPGNHEHILDVTMKVRDAGADSIRFKCDIGGRHNLNKRPEALEVAYAQIDRARNEVQDLPRFAVHTIHSREDIISKSYARWNCSDGCYYQRFLGTIGSDGNAYLCDHNTMPGGIPLGNIINATFQEVWESDRRRYIASGIEYTCQSPVCPPFGNRVNFFLREIEDLRQTYGVEALMSAVKRVRSELLSP